MYEPIDLTAEELSLLKFLGRKTGPTYVMTQDMPTLAALHTKGLVTAHGNVAVITDEGRARLDPDETVLKFLKEWEKKIRDPHAERLHEDLGEHADVDPLVLAIRKKIRDHGIDPNSVYPVDIGFGDNRHDVNNGKFCVSLVFDYVDSTKVK